jgi:hypothetical protein
MTKREQLVIHLGFHHQPYRMMLKCPLCPFVMSSDVAATTRKHMAVYPDLSREALWNVHL